MPSRIKLCPISAIRLRLDSDVSAKKLPRSINCDLQSSKSYRTITSTQIHIKLITTMHMHHIHMQHTYIKL